MEKMQRVTEDVLRWAAHDEQHFAELAARCPGAMAHLPHRRALLAEAFRTRTPIWINSFEALSQVYPSAVELPKARAEEAWAALPLVADGRVLGALGLGFAGRRHLDDAEREFVVALAALAAQAIARAQHRRER